ncbi:MAG: hypothetical protein ACE5PO_01280 [Candidatus Bathyarchaeia archaeon]
MNAMRGVGVGLLILGIVLLVFSFYNAYVLFTGPKEFEEAAAAVIQGPTGPISLEIPGLGSFGKLLEAMVNMAYLGIMIAAASKIAGKGIDLLKAYK